MAIKNDEMATCCCGPVMMFFGQPPKCTRSCRLRSTDSGERLGSACLLAGSAGKSMLSITRPACSSLLFFPLLVLFFFTKSFLTARISQFTATVLLLRFVLQDIAHE